MSMSLLRSNVVIHERAPDATLFALRQAKRALLDARDATIAARLNREEARDIAAAAKLLLEHNVLIGDTARAIENAHSGSDYWRIHAKDARRSARAAIKAALASV